MKKLIVSTLVLAGLFTGCNDSDKKDTKVENATIHKTVVSSQNTTSVQHEVVNKKIDTVDSKTMKNIVSNTIDTTVDKAQKIISDTQDIVKDTKKEVINTIQQSIEKPKKVIVDKKSYGSTLYVACAGCHGSNAQNKALGKSKVIKGWDVEKIKTALTGYKDGTYGGVMKGVMKGQVSSLSQEDIEALAKYISKL